MLSWIAMPALEALSGRIVTTFKAIQLEGEMFKQ